jgi:hypothetical protein
MKSFSAVAVSEMPGPLCGTHGRLMPKLNMPTPGCSSLLLFFVFYREGKHNKSLIIYKLQI